MYHLTRLPFLLWRWWEHLRSTVLVTSNYTTQYCSLSSPYWTSSDTWNLLMSWLEVCTFPPASPHFSPSQPVSTVGMDDLSLLHHIWRLSWKDSRLNWCLLSEFSFTGLAFDAGPQPGYPQGVPSGSFFAWASLDFLTTCMWIPGVSVPGEED